MDTILYYLPYTLLIFGLLLFWLRSRKVFENRMLRFAGPLMIMFGVGMFIPDVLWPSHVDSVVLAGISLAFMVIDDLKYWWHSRLKRQRSRQRRRE